jgi:hypothetical protein
MRLSDFDVKRKRNYVENSSCKSTKASMYRTAPGVAQPVIYIYIYMYLGDNVGHFNIANMHIGLLGYTRPVNNVQMNNVIKISFITCRGKKKYTQY